MAKNGLPVLACLKNFDTYLRELAQLAGIAWVNMDEFNNFVDAQWADRYNTLLCFNSQCEPVDSHSGEIRYLLLNTGLVTGDTGEIIYGGLYYNRHGETDLGPEPPKKWSGVTLGTRETVLEQWRANIVASAETELERYTAMHYPGYGNICTHLRYNSGKDIGEEECRRWLNELFVAARDSGKLAVYPEITAKDAISYFELEGCQTNDGKPLYLKMERHRDYPFGTTDWFGAYVITRSELVEATTDNSVWHIGGLVFEHFSELNDFLEELANKAMRENWTWVNSTATSSFRYPVLKNYVEFTYLRLLTEDAQETDERKKKLVEYKGKVYFNTGLLDRYFRQIFIVGDRGDLGLELPLLGDYRQMALHNPRVYSENEEAIARVFRRDDVPKIARYFSRCEDVVFDASYEVHLNDDHIFVDGVERGRLPKYAAEYAACNGDPAAIELLVSRIARDFQSALDRAKLLAERNYKLAVPQYWPETGEIQFLLPIYLGEREEAEKPECALALSLDTEGRYHYYRGETILTLDMAYNNARLLAKPDVFWLSDVV